MTKPFMVILLIAIAIIGFVILVFGVSTLTEERWLQLISLSLILAYLMLGLTRREFNLSESIRNILIWVGAGLFMIIAYSYQNELYSLKDRLLSELNPSSGILLDEREVNFQKADDGHYYINAEVNGVNIRFMLDTGASRVVLSSTDAKRIGINFSNLDFIQKTSTANGVVWSAPITLQSIKIKNLIVQDVSASVSQSDLDISLLGISFLDKLKGYRVDAGGLTLIY